MQNMSESLNVKDQRGTKFFLIMSSYLYLTLIQVK